MGAGNSGGGCNDGAVLGEIPAASAGMTEMASAGMTEKRHGYDGEGGTGMTEKAARV